MRSPRESAREVATRKQKRKRTEERKYTVPLEIQKTPATSGVHLWGVGYTSPDSYHKRILYCSHFGVWCECFAKQQNCMFWGDFAGNRPRKQKPGRKRPRFLENRRKLGQIDEKHARNPKKSTPGARKRRPGRVFQDFGSTCEKSPSEPGKLIRKFCQSLPNLAKCCKNLQKSANIGKHRRKHPIAICTHPTQIP